MKNITLKLFAFIAIALCSLNLQAQAFPADVTLREGTWLIKVQGQDLYLTLPDMDPPVFGDWTQDVTYEPLNTTKPELQMWTTSQAPSNASHFYITSAIAGRGVLIPLDTDNVASELGVDGNVAGDPNLLDVWNPTRGAGTQLFNENDRDASFAWSTLSAKRRVQNTNSGGAALAAGEQVKFSGGSPLAFDWVSASLSSKDFDTSSIFISNPVQNELSISGLSSKVSQVSIYSLLGKEVSTRSLNGESSLKLDVSTLASGIYILDFKGTNLNFSKKIIKQ
ncbi:T9SS type A sorting domain-containing protein [uncultured Algibacter sp.]|uniref:T9SS type A sorting domain-containing protein n=1 Tax=uncultured Algibacter sp. TaxID=298659 RepID=UPI002628D4B1|nr:T9SS type A sorting domain-containing protein [uncultured Algibacter sp.]